MANAPYEMPMQYLGFSGGGFDTIRVRDATAISPGGDPMTALTLDSIELNGIASVPEPGTLALLGIAGLAGAATRRRGRQR